MRFIDIKIMSWRGIILYYVCSAKFKESGTYSESKKSELSQNEDEGFLLMKSKKDIRKDISTGSVSKFGMRLLHFYSNDVLKWDCVADACKNILECRFDKLNDQ